MATGRDIRAGRAFVELFTKSDGLEKGLRAASARLKSWGASLVGIGAGVAAAGGAILAPLLGAVKVSTDMGTELVHAAARIGDTVENIGALAGVAEEAGISLEDLERAIFKFQREGGKGIDDFIEKIDALAEAPNGAAAAFDLFGKSGAKMLQLARLSEGGLKGMVAELKEAGVLMSGDDAKASEKFGAELKRLELMGKLATAAIGSALIPTLQKAIGPLTRNAIAAIGWIKANGELVLSIAAIGVGIVAVGGIIVALGVSFIGAAIAVSSLATIVGFILSPLGLAATAAIAMAAALAVLWATAGGGAGVLSQMAADVSEAFGGIANAIMAGNIPLALKIVGMQLRIEWLRITDSLKNGWTQFVNFFKDGADSLGAILATAMMHGVNGVLKAFLHLQADALRVISGIKAGLSVLVATVKFTKDFVVHPMQHEFRQKELEDKLVKIGLDNMNEQTRIDQLEKAKLDQLDAAQDKFDTAINRKLQAAQDKRAAEGKAVNPEIANLQAQIRDMIAKAEGERGAVLLKELFDAIQKPLRETGKQIQEMSQLASEVKGQFSSSAIQQSLGVGGIADRQIKELQKLNKSSEDIAGILKNMKGLAFE